MKFVRILTAAVLGTLSLSPVLAESVKPQSATTARIAAIDPNRNVVPGGTDRPLTIAGNATGEGLIALADGKADAALVSEPLDTALRAAKLAGKNIDASKLKVFDIRKDEIVFVVNPKNPVSALTKGQLKDILSGKITNWKAVGGKDLPITVYSEAAPGLTRLVVKKAVMDGSEYGTQVKSHTSVIFVAELVAKDEGGIGGLGKDFVDEKFGHIIRTERVESPLTFVTMGEPSVKVKQFIDGFRAQAGQ